MYSHVTMSPTSKATDTSRLRPRVQSILAALIAALVSAGGALAVTVVNVDFQPTIDVTPPIAGSNIYTSTYSGTAAAPGSGTFWNAVTPGNTGTGGYNFEDVNVGLYDRVTGSPTVFNNLKDSLGNTTPLGITVDAGGTFAISNNAPNLANAATNAQGLMREYLIAFDHYELPGPRTVTVTGLDPNEPLILYAYGEGDQLSNSRQTTFNANGVIGSTSGDAGANKPLTEGSDYVRITGITANASGVLNIIYTANNVDEGPFNGFQLLYDLSVGAPGDTDGDGDVDMNDYNNIKNNFRISGLLTRMQGDIAGPTSDTVGDGVVDFYDFIAWQNHFPTSGSGAGSASGLSSGVPEPTTLLLALSGVGFLLSGRRRTVC